MANMAAGRAIVEALRAEGVEYVFGLVGTTTNSIVTSIVTELYGRDNIKFIDTRHEEGAAFMAYGYARASGKPVACLTTSGPGTPGHGPVSGKEVVSKTLEYIRLVKRTSRLHFERGASAEETSRAIRLGRYADRVEPERVLLNVQRLYQEFRGELPSHPGQ